ncbi:hypothetical protein SCHPADRAFT_944714 [Schizopora paradoxa]|uniref:Uncharacterized protein n=1 Tax=Schizopora paradoxa TaxID=27342 RepID=A0A0H2R9Q4_9AGAM|nr:hypothetical protein SCHPADRAFT_944714 [Schizopora paradoxa]
MSHPDLESQNDHDEVQTPVKFDPTPPPPEDGFFVGVLALQSTVFKDMFDFHIPSDGEASASTRCTTAVGGAGRRQRRGRQASLGGDLQTTYYDCDDDITHHDSVNAPPIFSTPPSGLKSPSTFSDTTQTPLPTLTPSTTTNAVSSYACTALSTSDIFDNEAHKLDVGPLKVLLVGARRLEATIRTLLLLILDGATSSSRDTICPGAAAAGSRCKMYGRIRSFALAPMFNTTRLRMLSSDGDR